MLVVNLKNRYSDKLTKGL